MILLFQRQWCCTGETTVKLTVLLNWWQHPMLNMLFFFFTKDSRKEQGSTLAGTWQSLQYLIWIQLSLLLRHNQMQHKTAGVSLPVFWQAYGCQCKQWQWECLKQGQHPQGWNCYCRCRGLTLHKPQTLDTDGQADLKEANRKAT